MGGVHTRAGKGEVLTVAAPANVVHTFWNPGPAPARYLNFHTPGERFDEYLRARRREGESEEAFFSRFDIVNVDRPHPADT